MNNFSEEICDDDQFIKEYTQNNKNNSTFETFKNWLVNKIKVDLQKARERTSKEAQEFPKATKCPEKQRAKMYGITSNDCPEGWKPTEDGACCELESFGNLQLLKVPGETDRLHSELSVFAEVDRNFITDRIGKTLELAFGDYVEFTRSLFTMNNFSEEICDDDQFIKEYTQNNKNNSTFTTFKNWLVGKIKDGVILAVQIIKYLVKWIMYYFGKAIALLLKATKYVVNAVTAVASYLMLHPKTVRLWLFIIRRSKKRLCKEIGTWMVSNNWVPERWINQDENIIKESLKNATNFATNMDFVNFKRMGMNWLNNGGLTSVTKKVMKHSGTLFGETMASIPGGGFLKGLTTIMTEELAETISDAGATVLQADLLLEDSLHSLKQLVKIINPMECVAQMPNVVLHLRDNYQIDILKYVSEEDISKNTKLALIKNKLETNKPQTVDHTLAS
jgi:hypothetical protein